MIEYKRSKSIFKTVTMILALMILIIANLNQEDLRKLFPITATAEINDASYKVVFPLDEAGEEEFGSDSINNEDLMDINESDLLFSVVSFDEDLDSTAVTAAGYNENKVNALASGNAELTKLEIPQIYIAKSVKNPKMKIRITEEDLDLFERIVYCEAGGEDMVGMILIADVIINRVNSPRYPNNVTDVILQKGQFSPVGSGWVYTCTPSAEAKEAVRRAMNGEDYSKGAIGFFNRRLAKKSTATWFDSALRFILKHGEVEYFGFK